MRKAPTILEMREQSSVLMTACTRTYLGRIPHWQTFPYLDFELSWRLRVSNNIYKQATADHEFLCMVMFHIYTNGFFLPRQKCLTCKYKAGKDPFNNSGMYIACIFFLKKTRKFPLPPPTSKLHILSGNNNINVYVVFCQMVQAFCIAMLLCVQN